MTQDYKHPITPPPELVQQWASEWMQQQSLNRDNYMATHAAQWGADQELEACWEWLNARIGGIYPDELRTARRPKPPSFKEQALAALAEADGADYPVICTTLTASQHALIRRALEQLDD